MESQSNPVLPSDAAPRRSVSLRSLLLGLAGVTFICSLTAFNDYAMANTAFVGNFLPVGVVLALLTVILLVNAPLHCFAPRLAFTQGELAIALAMMLAACAIPSSGFMRYIPTSMIGMHTMAAEDAKYAAALRDAGLRDWLLPSFQSTDPATRGAEALTREYYGRNVDAAGFAAVPWQAWLRPALAWGAFAAVLWGACFCLSLIVHHQWTRNERLSYPLAGVYLSLIEPPARGRFLNATLRARSFWIAAGAVFVLQSFNALNKYVPEYFPALPLGYDAGRLLTERPLSEASWYIKRAAIYFTIIGICFFLQSSVSFSLWVFIILLEILRLILRNNGMIAAERPETDENLGAMIAFGLTIAWVGRSHWWMVLRHMAGKRGTDDPRGEFLSYPVAGWGFVLCITGMYAWIFAAGATPIIAAWIVGFILLTYLLIARVVAETGLVFVAHRAPAFRPLQYFLLGSQPIRTTNSAAFLTGWFNQTLIADLRENAMTFQSQGLRVVDDTLPRTDRRGRLAFVGAIALALLVGFVISGASMLFVEYNYAGTLALNGTSPINAYAEIDSTRASLDYFVEYLSNARPPENHRWQGHLAGGAIFTGVLGFLRLRFTWWPFHPIGYLLVYSYPMRMMWLSLMIGWAAKVILVRFGGASMIRAARPVFLGLIVGECMVAAFWLVISFIMVALGQPYYAINLLPS